MPKAPQALAKASAPEASSFDIDDIFAKKPSSISRAVTAPSDRGRKVEEVSRIASSSSSIQQAGDKKKKKKRKPETVPDEKEVSASSTATFPVQDPKPLEILDPSLPATFKTDSKGKKPQSESESGVGGKKQKIRQRAVLDEEETAFRDSRGDGPRRRTEEGFAIYKEDELGIQDAGGDSALCPFDCECCF